MMHEPPRYPAIVPILCALAIDVALVLAVVTLWGCGTLPLQEPPVVLERLTRVTWCAGRDQVVEYLRPDGVMSARLVLFRHPECATKTGTAVPKMKGE